MKKGNNKLVFANKIKADIIHEKEFKDLLGKNLSIFYRRKKQMNMLTD